MRADSIHLAIDAVGAKHGGAATVLLGVLDAAHADRRIGRVTLFRSPRAVCRFDIPDSDRLVSFEQVAAERSPVLRYWWLNWGMAREVLRQKADALLCLSGGGTPPKGIPCVTFLQQSLPFSREALDRYGIGVKLRMLAIKRSMRQSARKSAAVIVQTPTMRQWVAKGLGVPEKRIAVATPGVGSLLRGERPSPRLDPMRAVDSGNRLLYVGNSSPYKNIDILLEALPMIQAQRPQATLFLTCPADHPACRKPGVVGVGYLPGPFLTEAYQLATLFVMPSLVETVGLPLIEAASLGVPVIAADRPYAHDVCENTAEYFDPLNPVDLAAKVLGLLADEPRRRELAEAGLRLAERRRAERPYARMIDLVVRAAVGRKAPAQGLATG